MKIEDEPMIKYLMMHEEKGEVGLFNDFEVPQIGAVVQFVDESFKVTSVMHCYNEQNYVTTYIVGVKDE